MLKIEITETAKEQLIKTKTRLPKLYKPRNSKSGLAGEPTKGKDRAEIREGCYSYPVGKHHIFYSFDDEKITLLGVFNGRMDFERHL